MVFKNEAYRKAQESLYDSVCDVIEHLDVEDEETYKTRKEWLTTNSNVPCRVSFSTSPSTTNKEGAASAVQSIKLFITNKIVIPSGSRIKVTHEGVTTEYKSSGVPAIYSYQQQIVLERSEFT